MPTPQDTPSTNPEPVNTGNQNKKAPVMPHDDNPYESFPVLQKIKYFTIRSIIMGISRLAAVMPEKATYKFCIGISMACYRRLTKFRNLARRHLEIAFGKEKTPQEIDAILKKTYRNYGMNLAEFLMLPYKSKEWVESKVSFNDPDWIIRGLMEKGNGIIAVGAHFGSWELVNARIALHLYPIVLIVKAQRDAFMSKFIMDTRTKWGNEYIFRHFGIREECVRQLKMNKIIGLLADQNATRNGIFVDFFGKKASTVKGPAQIAMQTKAPVVPSFPARNPDGTITLHVFPPIEMRDSGNFDADLEYNTQQVTLSIEKFAREHPEEYFWWHRRWRTRPADEKKEG